MRRLVTSCSFGVAVTLLVLFAGANGPAALASGLCWGAAAASLPGSQMPGVRDLHPDRVCVHPRIDSARRLGSDG